MKSQYIILIVAALIPLSSALENNTSDDDFDSRIVGGQFAAIKRFPSQVSFHDKDYGHSCGGTLLSRRWVVSAAHCFSGIPLSRYVVRAGSSYSYKGGAISKVNKIIIHPKYNRNTFDYDIAMVELKYGFPKSVRDKFPIAFAKLAKQEPSKWSYAWTIGWGGLYYRDDPVRRLRSVRLKIIPRTYCNTKTENAGRVTPRMICAGRLLEGKGPCQGDSGGPLYQAGRLLGVTSWGFGCAQRNSPAVWTNVPELRSWILKTQRTG